jgi:hypothetical protein
VQQLAFGGRINFGLRRIHEIDPCGRMVAVCDAGLDDMRR